MSNNDMSLQLPTEIVERAVRDKINAAIASQLGNPEELIQTLVGVALSEKVDSNGKKSTHSYDNNYNFLEVMAGNFIRDATQEALKEYMEDNKEKIKEAVKKQVAKSPSKMAQIFMDGITKSMSCGFSSSVNIEFKSYKDYD